MKPPARKEDEQARIPPSPVAPPVPVDRTAGGADSSPLEDLPSDERQAAAHDPARFRNAPASKPGQR